MNQQNMRAAIEAFLVAERKGDTTGNALRAAFNVIEQTEIQPLRREIFLLRELNATRRIVTGAMQETLSTLTKILAR